MRKQALVTLRTLVHLAIWSQLGVLTRTFVNKFFQLGCNGGWGPCIQGENPSNWRKLCLLWEQEGLSHTAIILDSIYILITISPPLHLHRWHLLLRSPFQHAWQLCHRPLRCIIHCRSCKSKSNRYSPKIPPLAK